MSGEELEIEVEVRQIGGDERAMWPASPLFGDARRLMLASIGALAASGDEIRQACAQLVQRGELLRRDSELLFEQLIEDQRQRATLRGAKVEQRVEAGLAALLNRLNIPSKRDLDDLSARLAQLSARIEELKQARASDAV